MAALTQPGFNGLLAFFPFIVPATHEIDDLTARSLYITCRFGDKKPNAEENGISDYLYIQKLNFTMRKFMNKCVNMIEPTSTTGGSNKCKSSVEVTL